MSTFNIVEITRAAEIISAGLEKAAESLSFFMKEKIELEKTNFEIDTHYSRTKNTNNELLYALSTEIKGTVGGICYLVFSEEESAEICKVALSPKILEDPIKVTQFKEPLLMEVDNILSASVITQFADQLKIQVHGDTPFLHRQTASELNSTIQKQLLPDRLIIGFQTEFISSKSHFNPEFYWILEPNFMETVKKSLSTIN